MQKEKKAIVYAFEFGMGDQLRLSPEMIFFSQLVYSINPQEVLAGILEASDRLEQNIVQQIVAAGSDAWLQLVAYLKKFESDFLEAQASALLRQAFGVPVAPGAVEVATDLDRREAVSMRERTTSAASIFDNMKRYIMEQIAIPLLVVLKNEEAKLDEQAKAEKLARERVDRLAAETPAIVSRTERYQPVFVLAETKHREKRRSLREMRARMTQLLVGVRGRLDSTIAPLVNQSAVLAPVAAAA